MYYFREYLAALSILLVLLFVVVFITGGLVVWVGYFTVEGNLAAVEAVRTASVDVSRSESTGVMATAARTNAWIAWHQKLNAQRWTGWAISNQWSKVKPIKIRRLFRALPRPGFPRVDIEPDDTGAAGPMGYVPDKDSSEKIIGELRPSGEVPQ